MSTLRNFTTTCSRRTVERIDLWETEYVQVMQGPEAILEWYKGTGLRPYFAALSKAIDREQFAAAYLDAIRVAYPPRPDGRVLFPFRRLFLVAYVSVRPAPAAAPAQLHPEPLAEPVS
jgi:trans-aconitate methyltransferase